jgi:hypothetical protein
MALCASGCDLETPGLDAGPICSPDASQNTVLGNIDEPSDCQVVCRAAGRVCDDAVSPPCYQQTGGALVQYESVEFVQSCSERIAPSFQSAEGRLSLSAITCFCR